MATNWVQNTADDKVLEESTTLDHMQRTSRVKTIGIRDDTDDFHLFKTSSPWS